VPERRLAVIGHPLAAAENRLAFGEFASMRVDLILPRTWRSPGLGHRYRAPAAEPGAPGKPGLHPLPVLGSGRNSLFLWIGLGRLLTRLRPDVLYCWEEPWCLSARQAASHARRLGIPFAFYSAENRPKRLPWPFASLVRKTFDEAAACIAPTPEIAERVRAWGFRGPVGVIPLWVRPRRPLRPAVDSRLLAYVGRLIPLKRVDLLIEAMARLPEFRLRILGDGPERGRLEKRAADLGLLGPGSRVEFRGHVPNADLEEALEGCSLLVLPTGENPRQAEQFGKAAAEAITLGLPVLASRGGNLAALAGAFPTVRALDLDAPEDLARAVLDIHRDYPDPSALADARARAEAEFGPAAAARRLENCLARLAEGA
jgi:glycosyltransferase involved in cell wall biosynthesis